LKRKCVACERSGVRINKEHIFPRWLILKTNTNNTGIRWGPNRKLPALRATLPLCCECNSDFGKELEKPVSIIFDDIESNRGISDQDAELLIRWLWKIEGLAWCANNPNYKYTSTRTLRERILYPIDSIRENLVLAVSLIESLYPESDDWPMGIDSNTSLDAVFVSGVFYKIALMVLLDQFISMVPTNFSIYHLSSRMDSTTHAKLFFPKAGFVDDIEAVGVTYFASKQIAEAHDNFWRELNKKKLQNT
jgi:hypothetical protein